VTELREVYRQLGEMSADLRNLREDVKAMADAIAARDQLLIQERAANRRALWALTVALLVALIGAFATVAAAGVLG
jgi:hypothetical protein